jgi:hypothetical protein
LKSASSNGLHWHHSALAIIPKLRRVKRVCTNDTDKKMRT